MTDENKFDDFAEHSKKHFGCRGIPEYSIDGAINAHEWKNSSFRMAYLLKENYGYQGCGVIDTADLAHGWLDAGIRTYLRMAALSAAVIQGLELGRELDDEEVARISKDRNLLHLALERIAVVNVKKHSGESKSNDAEIRQESVKNATLLKTQMLDLSPHMILAGSTVCWHSLTLDQGLFESVPKCSKMSVIRHNEQLLCHANHPSAWGGRGFPVPELHRNILRMVLK